MLTKWTRVAAVSAALFAGAPALAAPLAVTTPPQGRALLLIPLTLTKVQDVSFGSIIPDGSSQVTVTLDPSTGNRTSSHPASLFASDPGASGIFAGAGTPGQQVIMALTPPSTLSDGNGNSLTVVTMLLDGPNTRTIQADHTFFVRVGGVIQVPPNAPSGLYSANYNLTADYQ